MFKTSSPFVHACVFALFVSAPLMAQSVVEASPADAASISSAPINMAPVLVSGVQPGPGLWKVSKGDHVMWVLGTVSPLPEKLQWKSDEVEQAVASSQQVLDAPGFVVGAHVGFFGQLFLLPSMIGLKNNPDHATLQDVLPVPLYRRWETARGRYLGTSHRLKRLRPMFAGKELHELAIRKAGLTDDGGVNAVVDAMADRNHVARVNTAYQFILENPRAAASTFKRSSIPDNACLGHILDSLDADLGRAAARANAWSTGDIDTLRETLAISQSDACLAAIGDATFAQKLGMQDVQQRIDSSWLHAARKALERNRTTFAMLPMKQLLSDDGYLKQLQRDGYTVRSPDDAFDDETIHPLTR